MDPLDFLEPEELLRFFACNKTEISCLDKPQTLLSVLRDHNLIPEDRYKNVMCMKSKENIKQALYGVLDWLETERSQYMKLFWTCVFKESIMNVYPTLKILRNSLMDGTFQFYTALPEKVEKVETTNDKKRKQPSEDGEEEEEQTNTERKKKKNIIRRVCSEEEQAGSSAQLPRDDHEEQQADKEPGCSHGNSLVFKVTCGAEVGTLHKTRFASGTCGKSIRTETSWDTPEEFVKKSLPQPDASWRKDIQWEGKPLCELTQESQKNDDECCVCRRAGVELVMCDDCPLSFHQMCHLPDVPHNILGDGRPWVCTFCVFRRNQEWQDSEELSPVPALSRRISASLMQCQYLLLFLYVADEEQIFTSDPRLYVEGYTNAVRTPMWLDKVAEKLQKKTYQTVRELVSDIQLIFTNCASFNRDNEEFHTKGARLKELFEREFKNVFSISEETDD
ncbi:nuclear body protein SP140-like protein isoform X2 [Genypterus blacodes]|uniref:nuclear body protein SP140-like protein isoform X2 n=1 Tax=Genypterus blacodes TaxID=154954 RepID=UPI003F76C401